MQFSSFVVAASGLAAAGVAMAQTTFSVNTPSSVIQCIPLAITWTGGTGPFTPFITAPGDTSTILETLPQVTGQTTTWTVDLAAGQKFTILITDSTGATAPSAQSPTIANGSSSCLSSSASSSASGSSSASSAASSSTASSAASSSSRASSSASSSRASSSSATATSSKSGSSSTSASSSAASSSTSKSSTDGASSVRGFAAVVAGIVGIGAAALA